MHVGKCVRPRESPSPRWADARHGALAGVHTLYSLYIVSTDTKHRYERLAEALQLYNPLQPSTALQLYMRYSIHPSTSPLSGNHDSCMCRLTLSVSDPWMLVTGRADMG